MAQNINPEDVQRMAQQMAQTGMLDLTRNSQQNQQRQRSPMEGYLAALAMAEKVKPDTALGFLVGQILNGGFNAWKERYDERGRVKDQRNRLNQSLNNRFNNSSPYQGGGILGSIQDDSSLANSIKNRRFEDLPEVSAPFRGW